MRRWLNKNVFFLSLTSFFNDIASELIHPLLPLFIVENLKKGPIGLGIVEGISELTSSLFKLLSGNLSDVVKERKKIIVSGYLLAAVTRPLIGFSVNLHQVIFLRFLDRLGKGIRGAPRDALISLSVPESDSSKAFSFQRAMDHFGAFIGPLFTILLLQYFSIREIFYFSIIPGLISVLLILIFVREEKVNFGKIKSIKISFYFKLPLKFYFFLFIFFIFTLANASDTFILLKAKSEGMLLVTIPLFWSILNLIKALSSLPAGYFADKFGKKKVLILGWLIYSVSYLGFAHASSFSSFIVLFVLYGIYFGLTEGVERAFISSFLPEEKRGTGFGLFYFVEGLGLLISSLFFGTLWEIFGMKVPFLVCSLLSLFASLLLIIL
ncbi:MAG: MFS transporter [Candidatus Hydrothermales bacterium]